LSNGNTLDLSTLENAFTTLGIEWASVFGQDENGGWSWTEGFEDSLSTDMLGQTTIINWDEFIKDL